MPLLAGVGFVAVLASTLMAMELSGSEDGACAGLACMVSDPFSGHAGIYRSQRIDQAKHAALAGGITRPRPRG